MSYYMTVGCFSHFIFSTKHTLTIESNSAYLVIQPGPGPLQGCDTLTSTNCTVVNDLVSQRLIVLMSSAQESKHHKMCVSLMLAD